MRSNMGNSLPSHEDILSDGEEVFEVEPLFSNDMDFWIDIIREKSGTHVSWYSQVKHNGQTRYIIVVLGNHEPVHAAIKETTPTLELMLLRARLSYMFGTWNVDSDIRH